MKKIQTFLALLMLAALLTGCGAAGGSGNASGSAASQDDGRLQVVATNFPGYDFARAVCGDAADVTLLLPPGAESHSYEPTPKDILTVQSCDLFVYVGGESDAWVDTILSSLDKPVNTLKMLDCVQTLEEETIEGMTEEAEEPGEGETTEIDEHVWTSPANAVLIVNATAAELSELDDADKETYLANAADYTAQIEALDQGFQDFFASVSNKTMVFGDRFPLRYFAEEYGVRCYAAFPGCSTQTEPSAATIAFLTDKVKEEQLGTVYYIEFSNHLVADSIAEATGAQTALFHSCHNVSQQELDAGATYVSLMSQNLETLKATMK
jgi:zinc transport system substrate-binding protein